jgi:hypothetical protein
MSPLVNGIALLGIEGMLNGTKAMTSTRWIDEKSVLLSTACPGTMLVYAKDPMTFKASAWNGSPIDISVASENPALLRIPVSDLPIRLTVG